MNSSVNFEAREYKTNIKLQNTAIIYTNDNLNHYYWIMEKIHWIEHKNLLFKDWTVELNKLKRTNKLIILLFLIFCFIIFFFCENDPSRSTAQITLKWILVCHQWLDSIQKSFQIILIFLEHTSEKNESSGSRVENKDYAYTTIQPMKWYNTLTIGFNCLSVRFWFLKANFRKFDIFVSDHDLHTYVSKEKSFMTRLLKF